MFVSGNIKKGEYFDSVTLMIVGKEISSLQGVIDAAVVMGTGENKAILRAADLLLASFEEAKDTDLLIAIKAENEEVMMHALSKVDEYLRNARKKGDEGTEFQPRSIEGAKKILPGANVAMISVAGKYAGYEAHKALNNGLHVMLFSDNIPLKREIKLKKHALEKGLLVMGPDCGTAIINGVPLAFANAVNRGKIGFVAAAGTGLQELTSIVTNLGEGVSQAIGTGGRDIKNEVGGLMFLSAMAALAADENTEIIVLAGKPPGSEVLQKIINAIESIKKPVVGVFLGAEESMFEKSAMHYTKTFEEAAQKAVALVKGLSPELKAADSERVLARARELAGRLTGGRKYLRGLFSGGSFCGEAQVIFDGLLPDVYSNVPFKNSKKLENSLQSQKNTVIDLGEDEFTVGRPHPMIDFSLRCRRIKEEAAAPETGVILLDVVLGYGSNMDPASELVPVINELSDKVVVVCAITGTDNDPQGRAFVEKALCGAGAEVFPTNASACRFAANIIKNQGE
ncbi:acyl-CoA synthetase FdrA [Candidatus Riflebacteria bacterium]